MTNINVVANICYSRMYAAWQSQPRSPTRGGGGGDVYIPHPAPNTAGNEEDTSKMGSTLSLLKVSPLFWSLSSLTFPRPWLSLRSFPSSSMSLFHTSLFLYGNDIGVDTAITYHWKQFPLKRRPFDKECKALLPAGCFLQRGDRILEAIDLQSVQQMETGAISMKMMERNYMRWILIGEKHCRSMREGVQMTTRDD